MPLDSETYLVHLRRDGDLLAQAAHRNLDARVPSCPEWDMGDLVRHTSQVHRNRTVLARLGNTEPPERLAREPGPDDDELIDWYREGLDGLISALREVGPEAPTWTWTGENKVRFWIRRMAQETTVHRWDAQNAIGDPQRIDAELAADGVDEFLDAFIPGEEIPWEDDPGTIHLHCTDVQGEWTLALAPGAVPSYSRGHSKADAAVRGTGHDLLMFVWRRIDPSRVEIFGNEPLVSELWQYLRGPGQ